MKFRPFSVLRRRQKSAVAGAAIISCLSCGLSHCLPPDARQRIASERGFAERHTGHALTFGTLASPGIAAGFGFNSDVKIALQSVQTMTVTNLHSLANSATAGWQSDVVDNTSNLFLDALLMIVLDFANTAPANSKAALVYAYGGIESGTYTNPCSGSESALTLVDITTNAQAVRWVGSVPYTTQNEVAEAGPFSIASAFGGWLPPYWGVALMNHSGAALASSGNTVKYRGVYATVI